MGRSECAMSVVPYRLSVELNVELFTPNAGFRLICVCRNLSDTGMYIHTREPAQKALNSSHTFQVKDEPNCVLAESRGPMGQKHCRSCPGTEPPYGMGIEFLDLARSQNWIQGGNRIGPNGSRCFTAPRPGP